MNALESFHNLLHKFTEQSGARPRFAICKREFLQAMILETLRYQRVREAYTAPDGVFTFYGVRTTCSDTLHCDLIFQ